MSFEVVEKNGVRVVRCSCGWEVESHNLRAISWAAYRHAKECEKHDR